MDTISKTSIILLAKKMVTEEQLKDAQKWQRTHPHEKISNILLARGLITDRDLMVVYAERYDTLFIDKDIVVRRPEVLKMVTETLANKHTIMPIDVKGNSLLVACCDPHSMAALEEVKMSSKMDVVLVLATKDNIDSAIERYYRNAEVFLKDETQEKKLVAVSDETAQKMSEIESSVNNTPVVKLVNSLVAQAFVRKASDIHIEPFETQVLVRMRIDGELIECLRLDASSLNSVISRIKILSGMNIAEKRIPQDGRFEYKYNDISIDLRVSTLPTIYGEKAVMRLLNTGSGNLLTFEQLGMTKRNEDLFKKIVEAPNGIILVTGPTGSGKSTTLYAALNHLNKPNVNITTVEDPVEKQMYGINQVQTNAKSGMTFAASLRSMLRQDPDVIMVGEIRDFETAEIATRAAITGHLVLSTLHTNDSIATIVRLIDMGIKPYIVSASVNAIIAQRLARRLCQYCKVKRQSTEEDREVLGEDSIEYVWDAKGCPECNQGGYSGRIAVHEVLELTHKIRKMISSEADMDEIRAEAIANGVEFLDANLRQLVREGITSMSEFKKFIYAV